MQKPIFAALLAVALFALTGGGAALAHECFNTHRSAQGNANATNSPNWLTLTLEDLAADIGLSETETEEFLERADEEGVPFSFTIFIGKKTIGENGNAFMEGGKASDGKGIDYFFTTYGGTLIGIVCGEIDAGNPICSEGPP